MSILEQELTRWAKSRFFANLDFVQIYWKFFLHADSKASQSFITPDGDFSPTHVSYRTTNGVNHLQSSIMWKLPNALKQNLHLWLDDFLLRCTTIPSYLDFIRRFL